jgi:hypothetical protein
MCGEFQDHRMDPSPTAKSSSRKLIREADWSSDDSANLTRLLPAHAANRRIGPLMVGIVFLESR